MSDFMEKKKEGWREHVKTMSTEELRAELKKQRNADPHDVESDMAFDIRSAWIAIANEELKCRGQQEAPG